LFFSYTNHLFPKNMPLDNINLRNKREYVHNYTFLYIDILLKYISRKYKITNIIF